MNNNKQKIKDLAIELLEKSYEISKNKIDSILDSGCVDVSGWDEHNKPMILPKAIVMALLDYEKDQYSPPKGIPSAKLVKAEFKNIRNFL